MLDKDIRYKPNERDAVMRARVGLFISVGKASYPVLARYFVNALPKVLGFLTVFDRTFIARFVVLPRRRWPGILTRLAT